MAYSQKLNNFQPESELHGYNLPSLRFNGINISGKHFDLCNLSGLMAIDVHLQKINMEDCRVNNNCYIRSKLTDSNCIRTFFSNSVFCNIKQLRTQYHLCDFGGSKLDNCHFNENRMTETAFTGSFWNDCTIENSDWFFVRMPGAIFKNVTFKNCRLKKIVFRTSEFYNCKFIDCDLSNSVFHRSFFSETEFINSDISKADNLNGIMGLEL